MGSGRSWNHRVYRLDPADIDRNDRFGVTCATSKCKTLPTHATRWDYVTGRAGRVSDTTRLVCAAHAEAFARRHGLAIGEPPRRPERSALAAAAGTGTTTTVRLHCVRGRQWYLQQHRSGGTLLETFSQPLFGIAGTATLDQAITEAETHLAARQRVVPAGPWRRGDGEAIVEVIPAHRHEQWSRRPWQLTVACGTDGMWQLTRTLDDRFAPITDHLGNHNMSLRRALAVASDLLADERWLTHPGGWTTGKDNTAEQTAWHPDQARPGTDRSSGPDPQPASAAAAPSRPAVKGRTTPPAPFRLIITGPPGWTDARLVEQSLAAVLARHPEGVVVVHGANPDSADAIADAYASRTPGFTVERHPADWYGPCRPECPPGHRRLSPGRDPRDYCPQAGDYRDQEMARMGAGGCVAFSHANSPEAACIIQAVRQRGIPVWPRRSDQGVDFSRPVSVRPPAAPTPGPHGRPDKASAHHSRPRIP
jgi:hypothetical protein